MDLTDPNKYPIGTRGKREQDDYKVVYDAAKEAEAIDANTDEVEAKLDTLISATSTLTASLVTIIEKLDTIATNTTPVEPGE